MLSLVLPTYNEAANITNLIDILDAVLHTIPHEIIVVDDDSPDGTWKVAEHLTRSHASVRVLRRVGRRGLSSAVTEGFDMAQGDMLAVMDADGQHDPELLLRLVTALRDGAGMVIGSRYVEGGSVGDWVTDRRIISKAGTALALGIARVRVSDPLGGFFAMKASLYKQIRTKLRPTGFKILLEILAHIPADTTVAEIPLIFRMRLHGRSKLSLKVHCEFAWQVLRLAFGRLFSGSCWFCATVFFGAVIAGAVILLPRAWDLRLLAIRPPLRSATATALKSVTDKQGWLFSDIELVSVETGSIAFVHREHRRNPAPAERCTYTFMTSSLVCEK